MLRRSRVAQCIVPGRSALEPTQPLSTSQKRIVPTNDDLHAFVMAYDHRAAALPHFCRGPCEGGFFSNSAFSGSAIAGAFTVGGVALFLLTFGYNIGKPVVEAHRKLPWKGAGAARGRGRSRKCREGGGGGGGRAGGRQSGRRV
ncbi:hypothetical protein LSCM1_05017 [Leishmania martiniquensis]|uniref:Transmembrane protein n=1 Tax=Leishmania martiniquensis TaxID=1580590 RepID=A0A836GM81_9TRYP|nr:hypothetical protein LSCM1_05017 [Leishmania martiniquensis]